MNTDRKRLQKRIALLALSIALLLLLGVSGFMLFTNFSQDETPAKPTTSAVDRLTMERLVQALARDRPSAIVQFTPRHDDDPELKRLPPEYRHLRHLRDFSVREQREYTFWGVCGKFSVLRDLNLRFPRWGHVEVAIKKRLRDSDLRSTYRLRALPGAGSGNEPVVLLAILGDHSTAVLDATFAGPLSDADFRNLPELYHLLRTRPFDTLTKADALKLLESPNPWIVWLGLERLDTLGSLQVTHYVKALQSRVADDIPRVFEDMLNITPWNSAFLAKLDKSFNDIQVFAELNPAQQQRAFESLVKQWNSNTAAARLSDLPKLQDSVRRYREECTRDPRRQVLLPSLDALLALKPRS